MIFHDEKEIHIYTQRKCVFVKSCVWLSEGDEKILTLTVEKEADKGPLAVRLEKREDRSRRIRERKFEFNNERESIS